MKLKKKTDLIYQVEKNCKELALTDYIHGFYDEYLRKTWENER